MRLIRLRVRDDEFPRESILITDLSSKREVVDHITDWYRNWNRDQKRLAFNTLFVQHEPIWVYEWRRRGSGDMWVLIKSDTPIAEQFTMVRGLDPNDAVTIE